jgi:hypothetical protein
MLKNKKTYLLIAVLLIIAVMIWNVVNEPGIRDLKGNFKEISFIRNEQNSGPVIRIYAVTVEGKPWNEMEQYGNYMPHTKYGITRIFFFPEDESHPSKLVIGEKNIPEAMAENCLAIYEKDGMGQVSFRQYPYAKDR